MNSRAAIILAAGALVIVAVVIIGSSVTRVKTAGEGQDAVPARAGQAQDATPESLNARRQAQEMAAPDAPETVYMDRPAVPAPRAPGETSPGDASEQAEADFNRRDIAAEIEEPSAVPLMQRPGLPVQGGEVQAEQRRGLAGGISPADTLEKGKEAKLTLSLEDAEGNPVPLEALEERHTQKIHLLVIDESLADFHHIHPAPGEGDGSFVFSFTPQSDRSYMVYADVKPVNGEAQFVPVPVQGAQPCDARCAERVTAMTAEAGGVKARLSFDAAPVRAGSPLHAEVALTDAEGKPLAALQSIMGAYAHIVGFYEGFAAVAHIHPLGAAPEKDTDLGASPLSFMLHPEMPGYLKLFVQIRVDGKDVFLPFGLVVEP